MSILMPVLRRLRKASTDMMRTGSVLHLNRQQGTQLAAYCSAYRSYLWHCLLPSPERNQALRSIQGVQGRLEQLQEQGQAHLALPLSMEEGTTLKQLFIILMQQYGNAPPSAERNQKLGELGSLRVLIERTLRQMQAL